MNKIYLKKRRRKKLFFVFVFFIVLSGIFLLFDFQFRPTVKSISINKAKIVINECVNEAVLEDIQSNSQDYTNLMKLNKNEIGEVLSLSSDVEKINKVKSRISLIIQKKFCNLKSKKVLIEFGTLTGIELLNGKGPLIPLKMSASGNVFSDFKSNFLSSGINQTFHQVYLQIHTKVTIIMPGCSCTSEIDTSVPISETVIVGKVPNFYGGSVPAGICNTLDDSKPIAKDEN